MGMFDYRAWSGLFWSVPILTEQIHESGRSSCEVARVDCFDSRPVATNEPSTQTMVQLDWRTGWKCDIIAD